MKRVAHLIDTTGPGGAETVFLDLVVELSSRGWQCLPVVRGGGWVRDRLVEEGFAPPVITSSRRFDLAYLRRLRRFVIDGRIDLVHAHLFTTTLYSGVVGLVTGVPVVGTFHGAADLGQPGWGTTTRHRIIRRASHQVVFVSHALKDEAIRLRGYRPENTRVIWNGIDVEAFRPGRNPDLRARFGVGKDQVLIGAVGNVRPAKDYGNLVEAARRVEAALPGAARFIVAGQKTPPLYDELQRQVETAGLHQVVRFVGFRDDVPDLLRALDVLVVSSRHEGFSLVTVQALATGLPVVATRCGGPEEILGDPPRGVMVPPGDPESLAHELIALVIDQERRCALADGARKRALEAFPTSTMVDAYERLYSEVLGEPVPSRIDR